MPKPKKPKTRVSRTQLLAVALTLTAAVTGLVAYRVATHALQSAEEPGLAQASASPAQAPRKRHPKPILIGNGRPVKFPVNQPSAEASLATPLPVNLPEGLPSLAPVTAVSPAPVSVPPAQRAAAPAPASIPPVPRFLPVQQTGSNVFTQKGLTPTPVPTVAVKAVPLPPLIPLPKEPILEVTPDPFGDDPPEDTDE